MSILDAQERYDKWWYGKMCRVNPAHPFKKVVGVKVFGPPSFVYGGASLLFEDGTEVYVDQGRAFRPRKCDVEVQPS